MAKRTRAPARGGCATQAARHSRKTTKKAADKTAEKPKRKTTRKTTSKTTQKSEFAQTRHASLTRRRSYTPEFLDYARERFEQTEELTGRYWAGSWHLQRSRQAAWHTRKLETLRAAATWASPWAPPWAARCGQTVGAGSGIGSPTAGAVRRRQPRRGGVATSRRGRGHSAPFRHHRAIAPRRPRRTCRDRRVAHTRARHGQLRADRADARESH